MGYFKRLKTSGSVRLEAFKMYYAMRASYSGTLRMRKTANCVRARVQVSRVYI